MTTIDRTKQPEIKTIDKVDLLKPEESRLDNGIPLYSFNAGTQDVVRIECVFNAGTCYQDRKLTAFSTVKMLKEGTKEHTAQDIAEIFDTCGAYIGTEAEKDYAFISLYTLNKHLEKLLPVFAEMIREPVFPQYELSVILANAKQEQMVSMERVSYLARIKFAEQLYGKNHPYGQSAQVADYDYVKREEIETYHKKYYHPGNLRIIAAGKVDESALALINRYLGDKGWAEGEKGVIKPSELPKGNEKKILVAKDNVLQSGIRIGKVLFTKRNPDYFGLAILNTILGGYFGSRLMTNIREEKGYTYGINSGIISMRNSGYMYIASEVGADVREQAIKEVYKELSLLRQDPVPADELSLVKNYLIGSFLRSIDGPFALADRFIGILDYGFDFNEYYDRYIQTINEITSQQLQALANRYFDEESFFETIAGK
jgi:zinc protease